MVKQLLLLFDKQQLQPGNYRDTSLYSTSVRLYALGLYAQVYSLETIRNEIRNVKILQRTFSHPKYFMLSSEQEKCVS